MPSPLVLYLKEKKLWLHIRLGMVHYAGTEWRKSDLLWVQLLRCTAAACFVIMFSGIALSLLYEPSARPIIDNNGKYQTLGYAKKTVRSTFGDTIALANEVIHIPLSDAKARKPVYEDSLLKNSFDITRSENGIPIIISAASSSVENGIMSKSASGTWMRRVHIWSVHLFMICLMTSIVTILLLRSWRAPFELLWVVLIVLSLCAGVAAWSGSVLPWSVLSVVSAQVVTGVLRHLPIIGEYLAQFILNGNAISERTIPRIFTIHAIVLPIMMMGIWIGVSALTKRLSAEHKSLFSGNIWKLTFSSVMLVCMLSALLFNPIQSGGSFIPADTLLPNIALNDSKPSWYFLPFYELMNIVPTDAFTIVMIVFICMLFLTPILFRKKSVIILYIGTIVTILIFVWLGVRGFTQ